MGYLLHGTKHRLRKIITRNHEFKRLENNIDFFVLKVAERYNLLTSIFQEWKYVFNNFKHSYIKNKNDLSRENYTNLKTAIKALQEIFIITYVDESNTNYAFICKRLYCKLLKETYTVLEDSSSFIIKNSCTLNDK